MAADASALVGREADVTAITAHLRSPEARLLTIVGPAGVGKTRLAAEVAAALESEFADGTAFVDVGATPAPELVRPAIARVLGVTGEAVRETMQAALAGRRLLLVLEDCRDEAAAAIEELVAACDQARILVTAEQPLDIAGERVHELRALEGALPLAREVAEAVPAEFRRGEPTNLAEVLDLAWGALDPPLQSCLAWLSVFAGGWTPEAAEAVCGRPVGDALETLVSRRLIRPDDGRFAMQPAIRAYAAERLDRLGEAQPASRRLAEWMLGRTDAARIDIRAGNAPRPEWRAEIETEANNLRAALVWAQAHDPDLLAQLVCGAWWCYRSKSQTEGKLWLEQALASCPRESTLRGDLLEGAAIIAWETGEIAEADKLAQETLALRQGLDDPVRVRRGLVLAGNIAATSGDYARAIPLFEEARHAARDANDVWAICFATYNLADTFLAQGDLEHAAPLFEESLPLFEQAGKAVMAALTRGMLGQIALRTGDLERAERLLRETVTASQQGATQVELVVGLEGLAGVAVERGDLERAARLIGASDRIRELGGLLPQESERAIRDRVLAAVNSGGSRVAAAVAEGHALAEADAAAFALSD